MRNSERVFPTLVEIAAAGRKRAIEGSSFAIYKKEPAEISGKSGQVIIEELRGSLRKSIQELRKIGFTVNQSNVVLYRFRILHDALKPIKPLDTDDARGLQAEGLKLVIDGRLHIAFLPVKKSGFQIEEAGVLVSSDVDPTFGSVYLHTLLTDRAECVSFFVETVRDYLIEAESKKMRNSRSALKRVP